MASMQMNRKDGNISKTASTLYLSADSLQGLVTQSRALRHIFEATTGSTKYHLRQCNDLFGDFFFTPC